MRPISTHGQRPPRVWVSRKPRSVAGSRKTPWSGRPRKPLALRRASAAELILTRTLEARDQEGWQSLMQSPLLQIRKRAPVRRLRLPNRFQLRPSPRLLHSHSLQHLSPFWAPHSFLLRWQQLRRLITMVSRLPRPSRSQLPSRLRLTRSPQHLQSPSLQHPSPFRVPHSTPFRSHWLQQVRRLVTTCSRPPLHCKALFCWAQKHPHSSPIPSHSRFSPQLKHPHSSPIPSPSHFSPHRSQRSHPDGSRLGTSPSSAPATSTSDLMACDAGHPIRAKRAAATAPLGQLIHPSPARPRPLDLPLDALKRARAGPQAGDRSAALGLHSSQRHPALPRGSGKDGGANGRWSPLYSHFGPHASDDLTSPSHNRRRRVTVVAGGEVRSI